MMTCLDIGKVNPHGSSVSRARTWDMMTHLPVPSDIVPDGANYGEAMSIKIKGGAL